VVVDLEVGAAEVVEAAVVVEEEEEEDEAGAAEPMRPEGVVPSTASSRASAISAAPGRSIPGQFSRI